RSHRQAGSTTKSEPACPRTTSCSEFSGRTTRGAARCRIFSTTHLMSALALFPPPAVVSSDCPRGQSLTWRKLLSHSGSTTPLRKVIGERVHKIVLDLELRNRAIELVREANHSLDRLGSLVRSRRGLQCDTGDRLHRCREISSHSSLLLRCG